MPCLTPCRVFTIALAMFASGCLDFDQYGEGTGGSGGTSIGGAPEGGAGGGGPTCPSDNVVPAAVCITGGPDDFSDGAGDDWAFTELGQLSNCAGDGCAKLTLTDSRVDLRSKPIGLASDCFVSIDLLGGDAQRTFLELIPDGGASTGEIPLPDRVNNIEVSVVDNTVRFEVAETPIPALVLADEVVVDQLRIQVRENTVVLEAFAGGAQVACSEQPRPEAILSEQLRAGFGIQGSANQEASFDNFGALAN